jgi:hypothetical protein
VAKIGEERYLELSEENLVDFDQWTRYELDAEKNAVLIACSSGFGDGTFSLYELVQDGERCGLEIEMIGPDEEYPF